MNDPQLNVMGTEPPTCESEVERCTTELSCHRKQSFQTQEVENTTCCVNCWQKTESDSLHMIVSCMRISKISNCSNRKLQHKPLTSVTHEQLLLLLLRFVLFPAGDLVENPAKICHIGHFAHSTAAAHCRAHVLNDR